MEFNNFMTNKTRIFVNSFVLISLALGAVSTAEAKRLGGGNSFGSKPSYSAPYSRSALPSAPARNVAPAPAPITPSHPAPVYQQPAPAQSSASAWKDRAMGAAAGLAVGGLVGSMMNNGSEQHQVPIQNQQGYAQPPQNQGYQQAPQQSYAPAMNQGYMDNTGATHSSGGFGWFGWLLIAGLGYGAYRYFSSNKKTTTSDYTPYPHTNNEPNYATSSANESGSAGFDTDLLFRKSESSVSSSTVDLAKSTPTNVPAGFDSGAFLQDVKSRYTLLQKAWDERDFAEIQDQLKSSTDVNKTDILKLEAEILEVRDLTNEFEAVVLFDTIMRESEHEHPNQVREVWHFVKSKSGLQSNWILDGIQQLED